MLLSNACEYGIRAAIYMAVNMSESYISVGKMSEDLNISFHFLTKTLQILTRKGLLKSYRGPTGGLGFAKDPAEITLMEIVEAIDGDGVFTACIIGLPGCSDENPCPLHDNWKVQRSAIQKTFGITSLQIVAERVKNNQDLVLNRRIEIDKL